MIIMMVNGMAKNLFDEDYEEAFGFSAPGVPKKSRFWTNLTERSSE